MYVVPGLRAYEDHVDEAAARHHVKVHKVPHPELARLIKNAVYRPHVLGAERIRLRRLADVIAEMQRRTGIEWSAWGERASDSYSRRMYTPTGDGVHEAWTRLYPLHDWLEEAPAFQ